MVSVTQQIPAALRWAVHPVPVRWSATSRSGTPSSTGKAHN